MIRDAIARVIREHRLNAGLTQKQLADALDMNWRQVQRWEMAESIPRPEALERVAAVLDIDESEFMLGRKFDDPQEALQAEVRELRNVVAGLQAQLATMTRKRDRGEIPDVEPMFPADKLQQILAEHDIGLTELARRMDWQVKTTGSPDATHAGRQIGRYGARREVPLELAMEILKRCEIALDEIKQLVPSLDGNGG